jgi:PEP-CTERM motif
VPNQEEKVRSKTVSIFLLFVALTALPTMLSASPIVSVTSGLASATFTPGESVTTPAGGPWNNITFNWYDQTARFPLAAGTLFVLTQEYLGLPGALSSLTPGFVASSQSIVAGVYIFDPLVTLSPNTQYFFYANASMNLSGSSIDIYAGGSVYDDNGPSAPNFEKTATQDANFTLSAAVPEPASTILVGACLLGLAVRRLR